MRLLAQQFPHKSTVQGRKIAHPNCCYLLWKTKEFYKMCVGIVSSTKRLYDVYACKTVWKIKLEHRDEDTYTHTHIHKSKDIREECKRKTKLEQEWMWTNTERIDLFLFAIQYNLPS